MPNVDPDSHVKLLYVHVVKHVHDVYQIDITIDFLNLFNFGFECATHRIPVFKSEH